MVSIGEGPFGSYPEKGGIHGYLSQISKIKRTVNFDVYSNKKTQLDGINYPHSL